jgi:hypothetical protein
VLGSRLESATAGVLRLADTEGTIWHARGMLVADGSRLPIAWDLEFWPLLRGEARMRVSPYSGSAFGPPRADIRARVAGATATNVEMVVPAAMIAALVSPMRGWAAAGDLHIASATFEWSPPANRGAARIVWQRALLTPPTGGDAVDFGTVTLDLSAEGDGVQGPIRNDGGVLRMQGTLEWHASGSRRASVGLEPSSSPSPALAAMLATLGATPANGWRVEWRSATP